MVKRFLQFVVMIALAVIVTPAVAQDGASLDDLAWLEGNWHSPEPLEYPVRERYWREGDRLFGLYQEYDIDGNISQYGIMMFRQEEEGFVLRIQYFNSDLSTTDSNPSILLLTSHEADSWEFTNRSGEDMITYVKAAQDRMEQIVYSSFDDSTESFDYSRID